MEKRKVTILIVDDNPMVVKLHEEMLKSEGYLILDASNGSEALAMVKQESPDLVLLDILMPPGMDGYVVAGKLKADPVTKHIPIIMITGLDDRNSRLTGLNTGEIA